MNGILKDELLEQSYGSYKIARSAVNIAIALYNNKRIHSSIGMLTPEQAHSKSGELKRYWRSYYTKKEKEKELEMAAT